MLLLLVPCPLLGICGLSGPQKVAQIPELCPLRPVNGRGELPLLPVAGPRNFCAGGPHFYAVNSTGIAILLCATPGMHWCARVCARSSASRETVTGGSARCCLWFWCVLPSLFRVCWDKGTQQPPLLLQGSFLGLGPRTNAPVNQSAFLYLSLHPEHGPCVHRATLLRLLHSLTAHSSSPTPPTATG